jgi:alpha-beta hydrolase superfamily lysophospholipase
LDASTLLETQDMTTDDAPAAAAAVLPGAEEWSHHAPEGAVGLLALHGFTGNPSSMRGLAETVAAAGVHVELPRLPATARRSRT